MGLLDRNLVVVSQKAKLMEITAEYALFDESGKQIGMIRQEGQTTLKKIARVVSSLDQFMTHKLAVYEEDGSKVLELTRPRKFLKSKVQVADGRGEPVGTIAQQNVVGKIRFGLADAGGTALAEVRGENWRQWDFAIVDPSGTEVGRVTKKWKGLGKELFTTADNYVIEVAPAVAGPLRTLILACGAGIDLALEQDAQGLN